MLVLARRALPCAGGTQRVQRECAHRRPCVRST